jgi:hypothetical protein
MTMAEDVVTPTREQDERESEFLKRSKATGSAGSPPGQSIRRLTVGRADDPAERLADKMADSAVALLRSSDRAPSSVRRDAANANDPLGGTRVDDDVQRTINSRRGSGSALRKRESEHFSNAYGTDLSGVRVHTDSTADKLSRSLQANAFTTGSDIFFRKGTYQPGTSSGDHLIGHELAHVATEGGGGAPKRSIRRLLGFGGKKKDPPAVEKHTPKDDTTVFQRIGMLLGDQLEDDGESVEFSMEISIPVTGMEVGAKMGIEAEKDDGKVKAKAMIAVTGGGSIPGIASIKGALGGYVEAKGADGKMAGELMGYALFRRLAESNAVPVEVQNYLFGGGDKKKADDRMKATELAAFGEGGSDEYYAESGGIAEIEAEAGGIKATGGATVGTRTDRTSLEMNNQTAGGDKGKAGGLAKWATLGARGAEKTTGRTIGGFDLKIESKVGGIEIEGGYQVRWIQEPGGVTGVDTNELGIEITVPEEAAEKVKPAIEAITHYVETKQAEAEAANKKEKAKIFVSKQLDLLKEKATEKVTDAVKSMKPIKKAGKKMAKAVGYTNEEKMAVGLTVDFTKGSVDVSIIESETKGIDVLGVKAEMKKSSKKTLNVKEGSED